MFWIGLHLDGSMAKWAKISRQKKKFRIELLRTSPLTEESSLSFPQSSLDETSFKIISGLDTSEVLLREIQLKIQDKKKLLRSLPFQIEAQLPCPPEEAVISIQISPGEAPKSSKVSFYVAKASVLASHIDRLKEKGAEPDETSCTPAALWRFAEYFFPQVSEALLLHIGPKTSTAVSLLNNKPVSSYSFSLGSDSFSAAAEKEGEDPSTIDLSTLSLEKNPLLQQTALQAKKELDRLFAFFQKKNKEPWHNVILTGNFSTFLPLKVFIKSHLPSTIELHECEGIESYDTTTLESYAIPIGLALDGLASDGHSTEFRQQLFTAPSAKKHSVKLFMSFALACLMLTSASLLMSSMYLNQQKKNLIETFQSSFSLQNKKIDSLEDLNTEISLLESALKKDKTPYQLSLPLPNVSEVLAWLSTHPTLTSSTTDSEVDIKAIKYNLIKYPKATAISTPYVAKVDLEIEISSSQIAKEFRAALQKENSLADSKKEITWQSKGSTYLVSFFLKSKLGVRS